MTLLLIKNGVVANVIVPPTGGQPYTPPPGFDLADADGSIGDTWDGTKCTPPVAPGPTLDDVKAECRRRITDVCSIESQSNLNGYINNLNAIVSTGGALNDAEHADLVLFNRAMTWIGAMRAACAPLVGVADYRSDSHWPALDADLATFAERF